MAKRPSFQFYPADWLSDPNVIAMTPAQRGAYIHLLALIWNTDNCEITGTFDYMAKLAGIDTATFAELSHCFTALESGKDKGVFMWQHKRLIKERIKQDNWRDNCAAAGRRGGGNPNFKKGKTNPYYADEQAKKIKDKGEDKGKDKRKINSSTSTSTSTSFIKSPTEIVASQQTFGKEEINKLLEFIKKELSLSGFKESYKQERIWGQNLSVLAVKVGKSEFVHRFKDLAAQEFYRKNMGSLQFIYKNIKGWVGANANSSDIIQPLTKAQYAALQK